MFVKIGQIDDLKPGEKKRITVEGDQILLVNLNGKYHAVSDTCTHQKASLSAGALMGCEIECPWHGAKFDLLTGKATTLPAVMPLKKYELKIEGEDLLIEI